MQKNIKKIIIWTLSTLFILPFSAFADITNVQTIGSSVSTTNATTVTLQGSLIPGSDTASGYFRYSATNPYPPIYCQDIYGSNMEATNENIINPGNNSVLFQKSVSDLQPNTTYFFCAIGSNKNEIIYGDVSSFTTGMLPIPGGTTPNGGLIISPTFLASITTNPAQVVNSTSAYLNGFYNSNSGISSSTHFEYRKKISSTVIQEALPITTNLNTGKTIATPSISSSWTTANTQSHSSGTSGPISYLLSSLSSGTVYEFRAVISPNSGKIISSSTSSSFSIGANVGSSKTKSSTFSSPVYGNTLTFETQDSNIPNNIIPSNGGNNYNGGNNNNGTTPLVLGQSAIPPVDATVHFQEGIETVLARQIMANTDIQKNYGYTEGSDLTSFAWNLADLLARAFGYINSSGKEIRVSKPDIAAYELRLNGSNLTIYEYYNNKVVNIETMTTALRNKYTYEYYYSKK